MMEAAYERVLEAAAANPETEKGTAPPCALGLRSVASHEYVPDPTCNEHGVSPSSTRGQGEQCMRP
jgi:hypothetical protein